MFVFYCLPCSMHSRENGSSSVRESWKVPWALEHVLATSPVSRSIDLKESGIEIEVGIYCMNMIMLNANQICMMSYFAEFPKYTEEAFEKKGLTRQ
ncbi:hypothetical protein AVEN_123826-1 [Araneus ventricosus]|uniref:Uncharacterized protein n=1 Tax=Araneus ventricosus TaxID=182803 RepID=A0A4Y2I4T5_ARAVE|nr:hypothetical protein AVEN_45177-1 [Araneus ventricosus]GBM72749.1 hypothetical protein AVEN_188437-1 [Araneus ventricosus]GBM72781.1 hypothetical protein AVEN_217048-1 [Araneus ventricosus]GBM73254.1 hypothetical protein AVEN_123826-1 [Araneus ventricosus]